jgi:NMD protein affecting ribosome stability and mRNA decay
MIKNTAITFDHNININVVPFDSTSICALDNVEITINQISQYSEDGFDIIYYYEKLNTSVKNALGQEVKGSFKFSDNLYKPQLGYNTIAYRFTPIDNRRDTLYGQFTVYYETEPEITVTSNKIIVGLNNTNLDYKIKINGKWYKTTKINNLKPNTKYKITIVQNATENHKAKVVYATTVKTKK